MNNLTQREQFEIQGLLSRITDAQKALLKRMQQMFPKGSKWKVTIDDRGPIDAMVIGHGHHWSNPGDVRLQNLKTECHRTASATEMMSAELIERLT